MNISLFVKKFINPMPDDAPVRHDLTTPLTVRDIIAPPVVEVDFDHIKMGDRFFRTMFTVGYPRFVSANWLEPLISFNHTLDIAMFVYPTKSEEVLENLKRKVGEMEATIQSDMKRGRVVEPSVQVALEDALSLQQELAKGAERFFQFGLYVTIPAKSKEDLDTTTKQVEATLGSLLIITKKAILQMEEGFRTTLPMAQDRIVVTRNMDTTSLATTFPFTTSELTANEGILYGLNEHNGSLVIFDRFTLENANTVVFGKSVAQWEPVLIRQGKNILMKKIGDVVEELIKKYGITYQDKELEGVKNPPLEVFSYDKNLKSQWTKVSIAARKPFSRREKLYKITTKSGRTITVTADHSLIILKDGHLTSIRGQAAKVGQAVPVARLLPQPPDSVSTIIPADVVSTWPRHLPQIIRVDENFLTLLGLTSSEGRCTKQSLTIYNTDPLVLTAVKGAAFALGATIAPRWAYPQRTLAGYNIQPNAFAKLFLGLGVGSSSGGKRVPPLLFSLFNDQIATYLRAYFEGDGTVSKTEVSCTSKSKELISDIAYLLLRFSIIGRIRTKFKRATNTTDTGHTYYELVLSGNKQLESFAKYIGFLTKKKNKKLAYIIKKTPHTNVDTIPTLGPILQKLYTMLYQGDAVKAATNLSPLKRGVFSPSSQQLRELIGAIENRMVELKTLRQNIAYLSSLPSLDALVVRGAKNRRLNRLLWQELGHSWQLMKTSKVEPGAINVLRAYKTISGTTIVLPDIKHVLYKTFQITGVSLLAHNKSLWTNIVKEATKNSDVSYPTLFDAVKAVKKRYRSLQMTLRHAAKLVQQLKLLAQADLFWDPIVRLETVKHNEQYVYDLTVNNSVFLAGHGGVFVHNSGSGKSYMVKLEVMRSLMFDTEVIIIDPENEYETMTHALGGEYIRFHFSSNTKINPFDLALLRETADNNADPGGRESELNQKILSLHGFFRVIMGKLTAGEDALLDRALILTYKQKGITPDPATHGRESPLMEDLYKTLIGMEESSARGLADRIEKFVKGSLVGIFDQQTNVQIRNPLTVFSIRDLEDELRPIAMYLILDFIWTKIRRDIKRRVLVVDEAWYMMKYPDSGQFLNSIAKRARKYYLGLTTISQDVEDFLSVDLGRAIIQNSSLQILLKQSSAAIDKVAEIFYLSEGEKHYLLSAEIGQGLFFAGPAHVAMRVIASPTEHELVTTNPRERASKLVSSGPSTPQGLPINSAKSIESSSLPTQITNRPIYTVETVPTE